MRGRNEKIDLDMKDWGLIGWRYWRDLDETATLARINCESPSCSSLTGSC